MRIVMIAHNQIKAFHDPSTEAYDRHELKLHKAASALVLEASDMCLFLNYKKGTVKVQGNKGLTSKTVHHMESVRRNIANTIEKLEDVLPPYKKPIVIEGADKGGK